MDILYPLSKDCQNINEPSFAWAGTSFFVPPAFLGGHLLLSTLDTPYKTLPIAGICMLHESGAPANKLQFAEAVLCCLQANYQWANRPTKEHIFV